MESKNKHSNKMSEYARLTRLATEQTMPLRTRHSEGGRILVHTLATAIVTGLAVCLTLWWEQPSEPTVYAICDGREITDLEEAQQHAEASLAILSELHIDIY